MIPLNSNTLHIALIVLANVVSVVGVIMCNKVLYRPPFDLHFPSLLMTFHFFCTWCFVVAAKSFGWFNEKRIDSYQYIMLGFAQCCSVVFVNLSLMYNSVGIYQVLKFSNVLVICCVEFLWKKKTYSLGVYVSLVLLVVGITASTVSQVDMTMIGLIVGCVGSLSTAWYQVLNKAIQTDYDVRPLQILQFEQPYTALFSALFSPATDKLSELPSYTLTGDCAVLLLLSGVCAFGVNVTCYLIIGKTSPITYAVVGHSKTVMVLLFGFVVMQETVTLRGALGLVVAFCAIVGYTHYSQQPTTNTLPTTSLLHNVTALSKVELPLSQVVVEVNEEKHK